jgi:hypothetical protein
MRFSGASRSRVRDRLPRFLVSRHLRSSRRVDKVASPPVVFDHQDFAGGSFTRADSAVDIPI